VEIPKWKQPRLLLVLGTVIILILITQNYLLVRKVNQSEKRVGQMYEEILRLTMMNPGDSVSSFSALNRDSSAVVLNPATGNRKTLMLVFTTWCHNCRDNMNNWDTLLAETRDDNIQVLGLCLDSLYKINRYGAERALTFPVYSIASDASIALKYKLTEIPQTILLSEHGKVVKVWVGLLTDEAREAIRDSLRVSTYSASKAAAQADAIHQNNTQ
jgi:peroxiredoxin